MRERHKDGSVISLWAGQNFPKKKKYHQEDGKKFRTVCALIKIEMKCQACESGQQSRSFHRSPLPLYRIHADPVAGSYAEQ